MASVERIAASPSRFPHRGNAVDRMLTFSSHRRSPSAAGRGSGGRYSRSSAACSAPSPGRSQTSSCTRCRGPYPFPNQNSPGRWKLDPRSSLTVFRTLDYPKSRGTIRLASADQLAAPLIDMGYLSHPDDATMLLDGMHGVGTCRMGTDSASTPRASS